MMLAPDDQHPSPSGLGPRAGDLRRGPFLLGRLGSAFTVGVQHYVAVCAKHYAANNIENGRQSANAMIDEQTLREIYARHFEMVIREGGASAVMAAYNLVNGTKATQSAHLLTDLLRTDFGFQGFVLSDWWAMPNGANLSTMPSVLEATAVEAVHAGLDMELPWRYNYSTLTTAVSDGSLASSDLTTSAARILEQKMRFHVDSLQGALGCQTPFTVYDTTTAEITKNDQMNPAIGKSHIELAEHGGARIDGAAQEREQHAADQPDVGPQDRRHRREGDVRAAVVAGSGRLLQQLPARFLDQRPHRRSRVQPRVSRSRQGGRARTTASWRPPAPASPSPRATRRPRRPTRTSSWSSRG